MAERKQESGEARQDRIQRTQHRPEQNEGYDEAVRGRQDDVADERELKDVVAEIERDDVADRRGAAIDERETQAAVDDVQHHEHSADRPVRSINRK